MYGEKSISLKSSPKSSVPVVRLKANDRTRLSYARQRPSDISIMAERNGYPGELFCFCRKVVRTGDF